MTINSSPSYSVAEITSIADLEEKYFEGIPLNVDEIAALKMFERYKYQQMQQLNTEDPFEDTYRELKVLENTVDYRQLLNDLKV